MLMFHWSKFMTSKSLHIRISSYMYRYISRKNIWSPAIYTGTWHAGKILVLNRKTVLTKLQLKVEEQLVPKESNHKRELKNPKKTNGMIAKQMIRNESEEVEKRIRPLDYLQTWLLKSVLSTNLQFTQQKMLFLILYCTQLIKWLK